jgi:Uma2 family endonuclease
MLETTTPKSPPPGDPPLSPREILPTMDDLPSEDPEEPGLPDEFHFYQPDLLRRTCRSPRYTADSMFIGADLNLYYDVRHPLRYKRPDYFLVAGIPRLWEGTDLRSSYVLWQEGVAPLVVVELLSPGTSKEDLVEMATPREELEVAIPSKWDVYEQILRVPYYIVYNRRTQELRFFQLEGARYRQQPLQVDPPMIWIPELELGLSLWNGEYEGVPSCWLRWCDDRGNWIATDTEAERQRADTERQRADTERQRADTERQRADTERQRAQQLAERLRQMGVDVEE